MPAYLRYSIVTPESNTPVVHSFPTETAMRAFFPYLPKAATAIDMWWTDETPRLQQPTCDPEWHKPTLYETWSDRRPGMVTCDIEIVKASRAPRRGDMTGRSSAVPHLTTGYIAKVKKEKELSWEALEAKWAEQRA